MLRSRLQNERWESCAAIRINVANKLLNAVRLANEGTTQQSRDDFIELANVWLKLAAQLESDRALLDMLDNAQTFGIRRFA